MSLFLCEKIEKRPGEKEKKILNRVRIPKLSVWKQIFQYLGQNQGVLFVLANSSIESYIEIANGRVLHHTSRELLN